MERRRLRRLLFLRWWMVKSFYVGWASLCRQATCLSLWSVFDHRTHLFDLRCILPTVSSHYARSRDGLLGLLPLRAPPSNKFSIWAWSGLRMLSGPVRHAIGSLLWPYPMGLQEVCRPPGFVSYFPSLEHRAPSGPSVATKKKRKHVAGHRWLITNQILNLHGHCSRPCYEGLLPHASHGSCEVCLTTELCPSVPISAEAENKANIDSI